MSKHRTPSQPNTDGAVAVLEPQSPPTGPSPDEIADLIRRIRAAAENQPPSRVAALTRNAAYDAATDKLREEEAQALEPFSIARNGWVGPNREQEKRKLQAEFAAKRAALVNQHFPETAIVARRKWALSLPPLVKEATSAIRACGAERAKLIDANSKYRLTEAEYRRLEQLEKLVDAIGEFSLLAHRATVELTTLVPHAVGARMVELDGRRRALMSEGSVGTPAGRDAIAAALAEVQNQYEKLERLALTATWDELKALEL